MLRAMTAAANWRSQPSLNVSSSEKSDGLPREYNFNLKIHDSRTFTSWNNCLTCSPALLSDSWCTLQNHLHEAASVSQYPTHLPDLESYRDQSTNPQPGEVHWNSGTVMGLWVSEPTNIKLQDQDQVRHQNSPNFTCKLHCLKSAQAPPSMVIRIVSLLHLTLTLCSCSSFTFFSSSPRQTPLPKLRKKFSFPCLNSKAKKSVTFSIIVLGDGPW